MTGKSFFSTLFFILLMASFGITGCAGAQAIAELINTQIAWADLADVPLPTAMPTLFPTFQTPSEEWNWYRNEDYGFSIAYPITWTHSVEWDYEWDEETYEYLVIHRDRSYSETAEVIVDIWAVSKTGNFDLINWLDRSEWILMGESIEYNATISGLDAIFQFSPAEGMIGYMAQLLFTNGEYVFRILFTSGAIPTEAKDIQIFIDSMQSFTLLSGLSGPLFLPTDWY